MLSNRTWRIAIIEGNEIWKFKRDASGTLHVTGGVEMNLLNLLIQFLKIKPIIVTPKYPVLGNKDENGSWTGLFGMLSRNEADITFGGISTRAGRTEVSWPSQPFNFGEIIFVTKLPTLSSKAKVLLDPFGFDIWLIILGLLILLPLIYRALYKKYYSLQRHFFGVFGVLLRQDLEIKGEEWMIDRAMYLCWTLSAGFLTYSYLSVLLAVLTVPSLDYGYDTFPKLTEAVKQGKYKCTAFRVYNYIPALKLSQLEHIRTLVKIMEEHDWQLDEATPERALKAVNEEGFAVLYPDSAADSQLYKRVLVSKDSAISGYLHMHLRKNFCCEKELNTFILRVSAAGLYRKHFDDYTFNLALPGLLNLSIEDDSLKPLSFYEVGGIFILLGMGYIISIMVLISEILIQYTNKNK